MIYDLKKLPTVTVRCSAGHEHPAYGDTGIWMVMHKGCEPPPLLERRRIWKEQVRGKVNCAR